MNLRQVFARCRQYRIAFNPKKSKIGLDRIDWVGHHLDADGIHFSAEQLSEVAEFPTPVGAKGLRSFLVLVNYLPSCIFSKLILMHRSYCAPMHLITVTARVYVRLWVTASILYSL